MKKCWQIFFFIARMLVSAGLFFHPLSMNAANYYFSSSGNDSRSFLEAQDSSTPWQSIIKLNSIISDLHPGDRIFFKRGDIFYGKIFINNSGSSTQPLLFSAYGSGAQPVISGFTSFTVWNYVGNHIWNTPAYNFSSINMVTINGLFQPIGRYPNISAANGGYLTVSSSSGSSSLTDNSLASNPDWSAAEVVIRKNRWVLDRNKILQHSGNTIQYVSESGYNASAGYGYFLENDMQALDQQGEWYYRTNEKKLGLYSLTDPSATNVLGSSLDMLVSISAQGHIVFDNLNFTGANNYAFDISNAQDVQILNCTISFSGINAVNANNTSSLVIEHCIIDRSNNIALNITNCNYSVFRNNNIYHTGTTAGMGKGDSGSYEAIMVSGNNNLVEFNTIDSTGYIALTFSGNDIMIRNNFISNYALVKDDGGGIYTWNNGSNAPVNYNRNIIGNIVLNGIGAGAGTNDPIHPQAYGIYIDDNSGNVLIRNNTVSNCAQYGLYVHNAHDLNISWNTIYNNGKQIGIIHDDIAPNSPVFNLQVTGNLFFSKLAVQPVADYKTNANDIASFGFFDSNYYCRPLKEDHSINVLYKINGNYISRYYDVEAWRSVYGKDLHANTTAVQIRPYSINQFTGNNQFANGSFNSNIGGLYAYCAANNCPVSWANNILDGGSLKLLYNNISGSNAPTSIIMNIGQVTANKNYILRFSLLGGNEQQDMEVFLRKSLSPYNDLSVRQLVSVKASRVEHELLLTAQTSESDASLVFDFREQASPLYMDNIQLREANVSITNADDSIRFEYNNAPIPASIPLDGVYTDCRNIVYTSLLNLDPYSSAVLISKDRLLQVLPSHFLSFSGLREGELIYLRWKITQDEPLNYFSVERALDGSAFTPVGSVPALAASGQNSYEFADNYNDQRNHYYRIRAVRVNGNSFYSNILYFSYHTNMQEDDIQIIPNPAYDALRLIIKNEFVKPSNLLLIQTINNSTVKTIELSTSNVLAIDISSLPRGIYIVCLVADGKVLRKKFIKL